MNKISFSAYSVFQATKDCLPIVVDSPHSGRKKPKNFYPICSEKDLRRGEDSFVEQFLTPLHQHNISTLHALFPRTYIDLNRRIDDIDPQIVDDDWDLPTSNSQRVKYGMGLIQRLALPGVPIYGPKLLGKKDILERIEKYYTPYHDALKNLIEYTAQSHPDTDILHINLHSMPSTSLDRSKHPDLVIGDRKGTTCDRWLRNHVVRFFADHGLHVTVNIPFQGVELIRKFSSPENRRHSLQIEINKALYMNENNFEKKEDDFKSLQSLIKNFTLHISTILKEQR